mmetsp:Transcript_3471/g.6583  ORF Transcript_3471/g.6583 Transcript_3471/m.6583 type:complete len:112 (-) Transcript_3471:114-449(-)
MRPAYFRLSRGSPLQSSRFLSTQRPKKMHRITNVNLDQYAHMEGGSAGFSKMSWKRKLVGVSLAIGAAVYFLYSYKAVSAGAGYLSQTATEDNPISVNYQNRKSEKAARAS